MRVGIFCVSETKLTRNIQQWDDECLILKLSVATRDRRRRWWWGMCRYTLVWIASHRRLNTKYKWLGHLEIVLCTLTWKYGEAGSASGRAESCSLRVVVSASSDTKVSHMFLYRRASYRRRIIHVCLSLGCLGVRLYMYSGFVGQVSDDLHTSVRGVLERRRIVCIKRCTIKGKSRPDNIELRIAHTVVRDQLPNFFLRIHFVFLTVVFRWYASP